MSATVPGPASAPAPAPAHAHAHASAPRLRTDPAARWSHIALPAIGHEARYGDRIVRCFAERARSVHETFAASVHAYPDADALVDGATRWSYTALDAQVGRLAAGLRALGIGRGERVALLLSNRAEFVVALYATQRLGAVTVPLSIREPGPGLAYMLAQCGARAIVHDVDLAERVPGPDAMPGLLRIATTVNTEAPACGLPLVEALALAERARWATAGGADTLVAYESLLAHGALDEPVAVDEEDTAIILYTSGTTGRPKGAMLTHLSIVHSLMHFRLGMALAPATRTILAVPASHVTGVVAIIGAAIAAAGATIVMPEFKASRFLALAARERLTYTILVPAMYKLCLLDPSFDRHDLGAWRVGGFGGAPMPAATIDELARRLPGMGLMNAYGATETSSPVTMMPAQFTRTNLDSVGLVLPCADVLVMDDAGRECAPGETGELWIGGPMVVPGYWDNPEASAREFTAGYWRSGDLGSVDADGFVRVFDRKKDMINRGGYKIYSVEVENLMVAYPGVVEAAVVSQPCPVLGERVHAVVHADDAELDLAKLRAWCAERLADYKVPETIVRWAGPLPRNANGKLLKRVLREGFGQAAR